MIRKPEDLLILNPQCRAAVCGIVEDKMGIPVASKGFGVFLCPEIINHIAAIM